MDWEEVATISFLLLLPLLPFLLLLLFAPSPIVQDECARPITGGSTQHRHKNKRHVIVMKGVNRPVLHFELDVDMGPFPAQCMGGTGMPMREELILAKRERSRKGSMAATPRRTVERGVRCTSSRWLSTTSLSATRACGVKKL